MATAAWEGAVLKVVRMLLRVSIFVGVYGPTWAVKPCDSLSFFLSDLIVRACRLLKHGLHRPPGQRLRRFAEFVFSKRFYSETLEPTLSDLELEYFEALSEGWTAKARWVHIRGVISFWAAIFAQIPVSLVKLVKLSWK